MESVETRDTRGSVLERSACIWLLRQRKADIQPYGYDRVRDMFAYVALEESRMLTHGLSHVKQL